jgi:hypothetical protein
MSWPLRTCVNSSSIAVFGEALPAMSESPRRSKMKLLREPVVTTPSAPATPRQLVIAFESPQGVMMIVPERRRIVVCLANLLMQAAGGATEEDSDDEC